MDNKKRLAYAIIRFLHDQLRHGGLSSDAQESLEGTTARALCFSLPTMLPPLLRLRPRRPVMKTWGSLARFPWRPARAPQALHPPHHAPSVVTPQRVTQCLLAGAVPSLALLLAQGAHLSVCPELSKVLGWQEWEGPTPGVGRVCCVWHMPGALPRPSGGQNTALQAPRSYLGLHSEENAVVPLAVAIQCLETAFGVTVEDSDLALPQTLPEIFEAAATGKVSLWAPSALPAPGEQQERLTALQHPREARIFSWATGCGLSGTPCRGGD